MTESKVFIIHIPDTADLTDVIDVIENSIQTQTLLYNYDFERVYLVFETENKKRSDALCEMVGIFMRGFAHKNIEIGVVSNMTEDDFKARLQGRGINIDKNFLYKQPTTQETHR